jgi:hypothetical protein
MTSLTFALLLAVQASGPGEIQGRITDASQAGPVQGALIEVVGTGRWSESDSAGAYRLPDLRPGWHRVRFHRFGYRPVELQAYVREGAETRLDVALLIHPLPLARIDVEGARGRATAGAGLVENNTAHAGARTLIPRLDGGHPLLDRPELPQLLATLGDVATRPDGAGALQVRGGSADHNLTLLDGAPVLNPVHAMGLAGALNPDAVGAVDVFAGVVPAHYGGRLSGVVAIESREPDRERWRLRAGVDGFSSGLTLDGPLPAGLGALMVSGRRSSRGVLASLYERGTKLPRFWDAYGALSLDVGAGALRIASYRSGDSLSFGEEPEVIEDEPPSALNAFSWEGATDAVSWRAPGRELVAWLATSSAAGKWRGSESTHALVSRVESMGARSVLGWSRASGWLRLGASLERYVVHYGVNQPDVLDSPGTRATEAALFGEWHASFGERLGATSALRASVLKGGDPALEPRVTVSYAPSPLTVLSVGYNRARQVLQSLRNQESVLDVAVPSEFLGHLDSEEAGATSDQVTMAFQARPTSEALFTVDLYARRLTGLVLVAPETPEPLAVGGFTLGDGRALGAVASAELVRDAWQASATYHLGRATRTGPTSEYRPLYQRTHWAMAGAGFRVSRRVTLRAALRAGSGGTSSPVTAGFVWEASDPVRGEGDLAGNPLRAGSQLNDVALPAYLRLDVGTHAGWEVGVRGRPAHVSVFLTVENILDRKNVLTYQLDPGTGVFLPIPLRPLALNAGLRLEY